MDRSALAEAQSAARAGRSAAAGGATRTAGGERGRSQQERVQLGTPAAAGGGHLYPSDYLLGIGVQEEAITTRFTAQEQRLLYEFDEQNKRLAEQAQLNYKAAIEAAGIYAGASRAAAAAGAEAQKYSADQSYASAMAAAQAAIDVANIAAAASRYDADTRLQIAQMTDATQREAIGLERQRIAAVELARPGDWAARVGFFRGQTPEQAEALTKYAGGTVFGGQVPGAAPAALPQPLAAPAAIVGEGGPELAAATPSGIQISPIQREQAQWLRGQGMPGMQYGGTVGYGKAGGLRAGFRPSAGGPGGAFSPRMREPYGAEQKRAVQERLRRVQSGDLGFSGWGQQQGAGGVTPGTALPAPATTPLPVPTPTPLPAPTPTPGAGGAAVSTTPSPIDQLPFLQYARAGGQLSVPSFQEWTGPRTRPEIGITEDVPPPWNYNLTEFINMTRAEQAMLAGAWRSMMMIPGETEDEMIANAMNAMSRSAWRGMALPMTTYGGW